MNCDEFSNQILDYIRRDLPMDEITKLEDHLKSCSRCQEEMNDLRWFMTGAKHNAMRISQGHISSQLLYEFVEDSHAIEPATVTRIEDHLVTCEDCRRDRDHVKELMAHGPLTGNVPSLDLPPKTTWISGGWLKPAVAGLAVAVLAALVWIFVITPDGDAYDITLVTESTGRQIVELPLFEPVRGEADASTAVSLVETVDKLVVLRIVVDVFEGEELPSTVTVVDAAGETVWTISLTTTQAGTGRILLLIDKSSFGRGIYRIEITDRFGASMGYADIDI